MSPPRILIVQNSRMAHHPRHHYRFGGALAEAGYDVAMLSQPDMGNAQFVDAVPVRLLPVRSGRLARMASGPVTVWRATRLRPDAIHVVTLELLPWALLAKLLTKTVVVYDSNEEYDRDMLDKEWLPRPLRPLVSRIVAKLEPAFGRRLDAVTTAVPATHEKFVRAGARTVQLWNYPPVAMVPKVVRGTRSVVDVLVAGTISDDLKQELADTAAELERRRGRPTTWRVVMRNADDGDLARMEALLTARGVRERFELVTNEPFTAMHAHLADARIGFILFRGCAVPQRIFEYMAAGLPFVISDLPWVSEVVDEDVGLLATAEPSAYAATLARLLDDPELQTRMTTVGPDRVRARYTWERESQKLVDLYREFIGPA